MVAYTGTNGIDKINVTTAYDQYNGLGGDDIFTIKSFSGTVNINGGSGIDTVKLATGTAFASLKFDAAASVEVLDFDYYTVRGTSAANLFDLSGITGVLNQRAFDLGGGDDSFIGSAVEDLVYGGAGADNLQGGDGDDILSGDAGDDVLSGGAGDDTFEILGTTGNDTFDGGTGTDQVKLTSTSYVQNLTLGTGNSIEVLDFAGYSLYGSSGADAFDLRGIQAFLNQRQIDLGAGNDSFIGSSVADQVTGGDGNDIIRGGAGGDVLAGGKGDDQLLGEAGDDILEISGIPGADTFDGGAGLDRVRLSGSVTANSLTIGTAASVEILDFGSYYLSGTSGADAFDIRGIQSFVNQRTIDLGDGNDSFIGSQTDDDVFGGAGVDTLKGGAGDDVINGGDGDDKLYGEAGDDIFLISGNPGNDSFSGGAGLDRVKLAASATVTKLTIGTTAGVEILDFNNYYLSGSTGADRIDISGISTIYNQRTINLDNGNDVFVGSLTADDVNGGDGTDTLYGGAGNDVLNGGLGNDKLYGEDGDDILLINGVPGADSFNGGAGLDRVKLAASVTATDFTVLASHSVEVFDFNGYYFNGTSQADTINLSGISSYAGRRMIDLDNGDDSFIGASAADDVNGGAGADTIRGGAGNDLLNGGAGDDQLFGEAGDDILLINGTPGADVFNGGDGLDRVKLAGTVNAQSLTIGATASVEILDMGNYYLNGTTGADRIDISGVSTIYNQRTINLDNGDDIFIGSLADDDVNGGEGADSLSGGAGDDVLNGGIGNDTLIGGEGNDTFLISTNAGADTFDGGAGLDRVRLASSVELSNFTIGAGASVERLDFSSYYLSGTSGADRFDIRGVQSFVNQRQIDLGAGDDVFIGSAAGDNVMGGAGADTLKGGLGKDKLYGGAGADTLEGGDGRDSFYFKAGEAGGDKILDFDGAGANTGDMLYFTGYGSAAGGAKVAQVDATHWRVTSADGTINEVIEFANGATVHASDFIFM